MVLALIDALRAEGFTPGVVSRGYGGSLVRKKKEVHPVDADEIDAAERFGDEPVLIRWKTGVPVFRRQAAVSTSANALIAAHPEVDVIIADDGLQHYALPRNFEIAVFDDRGIGKRTTAARGPASRAAQAPHHGGCRRPQRRGHGPAGVCRKAWSSRANRTA